MNNLNPRRYAHLPEAELEEIMLDMIRRTGSLWRFLTARRAFRQPPVELRNQARVHLWFAKHFSYEIAPIINVEDGIDRFASTTHEAKGARQKMMWPELEIIPWPSH